MLSFYGKLDKGKRVRFLRKLIITAALLSSLIPICICVILAVKYDRSKTRLEQAAEDIAWYREHYGESELSDEDAPVRKYFDAANVVLAATNEQEETRIPDGLGTEIGVETAGSTGIAEEDSITADTAGEDGSVNEDTVGSAATDTGDDADPSGEENGAIDRYEENADGEASSDEFSLADIREDSDITRQSLPSSARIGSEERDSWDGIRRVYLTFDDGPSSSTGDILDILQKYEVKATFFVTGKEDAFYQPLYKRIVEDGHTLGMHSYSHKYSEVYSSLDGFQTDLHKLQTFLYETTGVWSKLYRFPGGSSNTVSKVDMAKLADYLDHEEIVYFDWNVASGDDRAGTTIEQLVSNVLTGVPKYRNCVILMHDAADKKNMVEALPQIIQGIQEMDDTVFLPITQETEPVKHREYE